MTTTRTAQVISKSSEFETIKRYLPANYQAYVASGVAYKGESSIFITGHDHAGWTLDGYVIPRLASGLHTVREIESADVVPAIRVGEDVFAVVDEVTGNLLEELDVSEQCDSCGKNHIVLSTIDNGGVPEYVCLECLFQYPIFNTIAERAVFQ